MDHDDRLLRVAVTADTLIGLGLATRAADEFMLINSPPIDQAPHSLKLDGVALGTYTVGGISASYVSAAERARFILTLHRTDAPTPTTED